MKKIIIAAALIITSGVLPSCTKQADVKPTATIEINLTGNMKDVGTAD
jgi:hypothetical protein